MLAEIALGLRDRVSLPDTQLFRLVGVGLSNFQADGEPIESGDQLALNDSSFRGFTQGSVSRSDDIAAMENVIS